MSKDGDIKAAVFQRLHPRLYLERFIAENVRPDGREFMAWREVSINVGTVLACDINRILTALLDRIHHYCRWVSVGTHGRYNDCLWDQG